MTAGCVFILRLMWKTAVVVGAKSTPFVVCGLLHQPEGVKKFHDVLGGHGFALRQVLI